MLMSGAECSLLFFIAGSMQRKIGEWNYPPSLFWGLGTSIHFFGVLALLTQGRSSPWLGVVFSNSMMILGQLFIILGVRRLIGRKLPILRYSLFWIVYTMFSILFTLLYPSPTLRVVFFSVAISLFYLEGAALCFAARTVVPGPLPASMAATFALLALFFLARAGVVILMPQASIFNRNAFNVSTFVVSHFGLIAWCLGLILMQSRRTEQKLEKAYEEKETLFRELQHRVKNSISVISGLVNLEASRVGDPRMTQVLDGLQGRISAIASLYEQLFHSGQAGRVELDRYLEEVAKTVFSGQAASERGIALDLALESATIDAKRAVPLGIIATELLTDSLKYAFTGNRGGNVRMTLPVRTRT
jgi:two-component sensor histidine kinase